MKRKVLTLLISSFLTFLTFLSNASSRSLQGQVNSEKKYSSFKLEILFRLNTSDQRLNEVGLFDFTDFEVDPKGNLYVLSSKSDTNSVFKFDPKGQFLKALVKKGQGPGEIERASLIHLTHDANLFLRDEARQKAGLYDLEGKMLTEKKTPLGMWNLYPLPNGNYLGLESIFGAQVKEWGLILALLDNEFKKIKELDRLTFPNPYQQKSVDASLHMIFFEVTANKIYAGCGERSYEFQVYDLNGNLIKKITREYQKSKNIEEFKKIVDQEIGETMSRFGIKIIYPQYVPPFYSFFTDDSGYLFVMTYEKGKDRNEYIYEILSPDGDFINRIALDPVFTNGHILAKVRKGNLYWIREKESGEKELIAARIN